MKNGCFREEATVFVFNINGLYLMTVMRLVITPFSVAMRTM